MKNIWNKFVSFWQTEGSDLAVRSLVKAYTYRCCGTCTTMCISYYFTRKWIISFSIGAIEMIIKPFVYWSHERVWQTVKWGRK